MTPRFIVADAGPLIALAVGNILSDSVAMLGGLLVPQIVLDECLEDPSAAGASIIKALASAGPPQVAFTVIPNSDITPLDEALARGLGSGEVAVLAYARMHGHVALIDERRARRIATKMNVPVVGTGTIVVELRVHRHIASVIPILRMWKTHGYHLSAAITADIIERAGETLPADL